MALDHSLFSYTASFKAAVTHYMVIDSEKFEYYDLFEAVDGLKDHVLTNERMIKALKQAGVITSGGSHRWMSGGSEGPNYDDFMKLCAEYETLYITDSDRKVKEMALINSDQAPVNAAFSLVNEKSRLTTVCLDVRGVNSGLTVGREYVYEEAHTDIQSVRIYNDLQKLVWYEKWRFDKWNTNDDEA